MPTFSDYTPWCLSRITVRKISGFASFVDLNATERLSFLPMPCIKIRQAFRVFIILFRLLWEQIGRTTARLCLLCLCRRIALYSSTVSHFIALFCIKFCLATWVRIKLWWVYYVLFSSSLVDTLSYFMRLCMTAEFFAVCFAGIFPSCGVSVCRMRDSWCLLLRVLCISLVYVQLFLVLELIPCYGVLSASSLCCSPSINCVMCELFIFSRMSFILQSSYM